MPQDGWLPAAVQHPSAANLLKRHLMGGCLTSAVFYCAEHPIAINQCLMVIYILLQADEAAQRGRFSQALRTGHDHGHNKLNSCSAAQFQTCTCTHSWLLADPSLMTHRTHLRRCESRLHCPGQFCSQVGKGSNSRLYQILCCMCLEDKAAL